MKKICFVFILIFVVMADVSVFSEQQAEGSHVFSQEFSGVQGQNGWYYQYRMLGSSDFVDLPVFDSDGGINTWCVSLPAGDPYSLIRSGAMHPGIDRDTVLTWVATHSGVINITSNGNFRKEDTNPGGDGVIISILQENTEVHSSSIISTDGEGYKPDIDLSVQKGQRIRFVINQNGYTAYDYTYIDPVIEYLTVYDINPVHVFSDEFSDIQGQNGWYYQYKMDGSNEYVNLQFYNADTKTWRVNQDTDVPYSLIISEALHPGTDRDTAITWVVPYSGVINVSTDTNIRKHVNGIGGDGTMVSFLHGDTEFYSQEIGGTDEIGYMPDVNIEVKKGDLIHFVVSKKGDTISDYTCLNPKIVYLCGMDFQTADGESLENLAQSVENGVIYPVSFCVNMTTTSQGQDVFVGLFDTSGLLVDWIGTQTKVQLESGYCMVRTMKLDFSESRFSRSSYDGCYLKMVVFNDSETGQPKAELILDESGYRQ